MAVEKTGECWGVVAASEMGKGVWLKQQLKRLNPKRLLVWDHMSEYGEFATPIATLAELYAAVKAAGKGGGRFGYHSRAKSEKLVRAEFESWCEIAYTYTGAMLIAEELSAVTTPSYAPQAWKKLNVMGRHHQGLHIVGVSQSPAQVDKSFFGNTTLLHVGYLGTMAHRKVMANEMGIKPEEIDALKPLEFLEFERRTKTLTRGKVKITPRRG